jgi:UDP-N-acetylglucosamine 4-epimerase
MTSRDFTFVSNVVQANIKALFSSQILQHEVFNVACGEQTSLKELVFAIAQNLEISVDAIYAPERSGDVKHSLADITKAQMVLDYHPEILFKDGLGHTVSYFKNVNSKETAQ